MKITADFYTPDEAALAAGIVMKSVPQVLDINIDGSPADLGGGINYGVFTAFNQTGDSPRYSFPLFREEDENTEKRGVYSARFICREEDAKSISQILVNKGGHNITTVS